MITTTARIAFERVFKTFKRLNKQIYPQDTEAMNTLFKELNSAYEQNVRKEPLFIKMTCLLMFEYLHRYGSAKDAVFMIKKNLEYDYETLLMKIHSEINAKEIKNTFDLMEIDEKEHSDLEKRKIVLEKLNSFWTNKHIDKSIINLVNDLITSERTNGL